MKVSVERASGEFNWVKDIRASVNLTPYDEAMVTKCIAVSPYLWRGIIDGGLACVWGLIPPTLLSSQAYLWLFTTPLAEQHQFVLVRYSQLMVQEMLKHFDLLVGHGIIGNDRGNRWLRWLGAEFGEPKGKMIPFVIRKKNG